MPVRETQTHGADKIVGATAKRVDTTMQAEADGADYLGVGAICRLRQR
ncbi:MAG: thiamine phosphate synthase [[Clostridium] innocuum]